MSADSRHNVIIIMLFTVMLPMVMVLVTNLGIFPAFYDEEQADVLANPADIMLDVSNWNWESLLISGMGAIALVAIVVFRLSVGAGLYAITFVFFNTYMINLLNCLEGATFGFPSSLSAIITLAMTFIFLYALIRFAST